MKKNILIKILPLLIFLFIYSTVAQGQYTVNFEGASEIKGGYASGSVTLSGKSWNMTEALIGNLPADWKNGLKSARMNGFAASSMTMLENKANGIGTISFKYRRYGTDSQVDWKVEYSINNGVDWTQIGSSFTAPASDVVQTFSEIVNVTGNIRVRIKRATESGTSNKRLNIDDITITDYIEAIPTISVTSPNGGESWEQGSTHNITWTSSDFTGNIKIELDNGAGGLQTLANDIPVANGSWSWTIDAGQTVGSNYKIKISDQVDGDPFDLSNATFSITALPSPTLTVTSPNGGESWEQGSSHAITWTSANFTGNIMIELESGAKATEILVENISAALGTWNWDIPADQALGADYKIKISDQADGEPSDLSNAVFSIITPLEPVLTVTSPNGGESWFQGSTKNITWTTENFSGNIKIELESGAKATETLIENVSAALGTWSWNIPAGQALGSDYKIKISDQADGDPFDYSNASFSIVALPALVINEIMYNSIEAGDNEWIELYNTGLEIVDLTGFVIKDNDNNHSVTFPSGFSINPGQFFTVAIKINTVPMFFTPDWDANAGWGLDNSGDQVRLFHPTGDQIDIVSYDDETPWPVSPDGSGPSLSLLSPDLDNSVGTNWAASRQNNGTPGAENFPPVVTVTSPNGGEAWEQGSIHNITWTSLDFSGNIKIELDNGADALQTLIENIDVTTGSWSWTIDPAQTLGISYKIKISDQADGSPSDFSDAVFSITAPPVPVITVTSPNGGESWEQGSTHAITWTTENFAGDVKIELESGAKATEILIENVSAALGTWSWNIPVGQALGADYKIKISDQADGIPSDQSDVVFSITAPPLPVITVTSPNGGESWEQGSTHAITWTTENFTGDVKIELESGAKATEILAENVSAALGTWSWNIPTGQALGADYKIKISDQADGIPSDQSDVVFSITAPPLPVITVTSPNGGEKWEQGSTHAITWTTENFTGDVKIELESGAKASEILIENVSAALGTWNWDIPAGQALGADYKIKISDQADGDPTDQSNASFSIIAPPLPVIMVTSPNGGESWEQGSTHAITWTTENFTGNVKIELESGAKAIEILVENVSAALGMWNWDIPAGQALGSDYKVKISDQADGSPSDFSDAVFSVTAPPPPVITVTSPNGGESWEQGSTHAITWTTENFTGNVKIELETGTKASEILIENVSAVLGTWSWTIPVGQTAGSDYKIKISDQADGDPVDYSNAAFSITALPVLVINEIMYNTPGDDNEWIEIYNPGTSIVNLQGFYILDNLNTNTKVTFPAGYSISPGQYFTVSLELLAPPLPFTPDFVGNPQPSWSLGNTSDQVRIFNPNGVLIDLVTYFDSSPWPTGPDGGGPSLSLLNPGFDNNVGSNWAASRQNGGTPGAENFPPVVTVTSPNGGELWEQGSIHNITWTSLDFSGNIKIELDNGADALQTLIENIDVTTGSWSWTIDPAQTLGSSYKIKISDQADGSPSDFSDAVFSITAPPLPVITVTSPNGGESWEQGSTHAITWTTENFTGNVKIELESGAKAIEILVENVSAALGTWNWDIPAGQALGSDYKVKISDQADGSPSDFSDAVFSVTAPPPPVITVTSPNGGESWEQGSIYPITWTTENFTGNVKIELESGAKATEILIENVSAALGTWSWTIPVGQTAASDYKIKISDQADGDPVDYSNAAFSITALPVLVINEIMYNSTGSDNEWIEICNPGTSVVNLQGFYILDNSNSSTKVTFPAGYSISPGQYFTVSLELLAPPLPFVPDFVGNPQPSWSLGNTSDQVRIFNPNGVLIDLVTYFDSSPWPTGPDGGGPSLSLLNPGFDNNVGTSWASSRQTGGTPGAENFPPVVTVTSPNGGESWMQGEVHSITWTYSDFAGNIKIELLSGTKASEILAENIPVANGTWSWTIPDLQTPGSDYKIKISDQADGNPMDESDAAFTIVAMPRLFVTSPNGGESWMQGEVHNITWTNSDFAGNIKIELLSGTKASEIIVENIAVANGSWGWTIPDLQAVGSDYKIRISDQIDGNPVDESDAAFTIVAMPRLFVTSPNGGESWMQGEIHNITWTSSDFTGNIKIELESGAKASQILAENIPVADGFWSWTIPDLQAVGSDYKIKISDQADGNPMDESNATFEIVGMPRLLVTSPNGGESWMQGEVHNITWTYSDFSGNIKIELLSGTKAPEILAENIPVADGSWGWTIPDLHAVGSDYKIRISDQIDGNPVDESDAAFTIVAVPRLFVTSPNGGESWMQGEIHNISWTSSDFSGSIKIELLSGTKASEILAEHIPVANGTWSWTIPDLQTPGSDYKIKISDQADGNPMDESDAAFTIVAMPRLFVTSPKGGESWMQGSVHAITWSSSDFTGNIKIELESGAKASEILAENIPVAIGTWSWTIPDLQTVGSDYKIKISDQADGNPMDESDATFTIVAMPRLFVTSPNGGELWELGSVHPIVWTYSDFAGNIKIELLSGTKASEILAENIPVADGTWSWTIPEDQSIGDDYKIRISDLEDGSPEDESNAAFAIFDPVVLPVIVITEIMYNPPVSGAGSLEFIELYNNDEIPVNLEGWHFSKGIGFTFPHYVLQAGDYVVIGANAGVFESTFGVPALQWTIGDLSNDGEEIELKTANDDLIDYVEYNNEGAWPVTPDGAGPSVSLCDPGSDNAIAENWKASVELAKIINNGTGVYCTPGAGCGSKDYLSVYYPQGWVGISANVIPDKLILNQLFAPAMNSFMIMLNESGIFWPAYNFNTIGNWNYKKGYKAKFSSKTYFVYEGTAPEDRILNLGIGNYYIPVLSDGIVEVSDVITPLGNAVDFLMEIHSGRIYWPAGGITPGSSGASLNYLIPGYSYYIKVLSPAAIDFGSKSAGENVYEPSVAFENVTGWNDVMITGDQHVISLFGQALVNLQPDDVIGVFDQNGFCSGMSKYNADETAIPVVVYGDDMTTGEVDGMTIDEQMELRIFRKGEVLQVTSIYNPQFEDHDGLFTPGGLSVITELKFGATNIAENEASPTIYPNPGNGVFNIKVNNPVDLLEVYSVTGSCLLVREITNQQFSIDLSNLEKGLYYLKLRDKNSGNSYSEKIMIQ